MPAMSILSSLATPYRPFWLLLLRSSSNWSSLSADISHFCVWKLPEFVPELSYCSALPGICVFHHSRIADRRQRYTSPMIL
ncbi:hypothetical protein C8J55DRAFT_498263 [Lentinula edodes]|uniref:Uncharacterized protein n=1 Tax=Lentinula lateritia TaxID=40482 RepID=A0A9W9B219_9AGAR|nr:hypothetical protein C8J55DRAFT_498263 [Lentinula edodes]